MKHFLHLLACLMIVMAALAFLATINHFFYLRYAHPGDSFIVHYGMSLPDLINFTPFLIFGALTGLLSRRIFGHRASFYRPLVLIVLALLFLGVDGTFFPQNWGQAGFLVRLPSQILCVVAIFLAGSLFSRVDKKKQ